MRIHRQLCHLSAKSFLICLLKMIPAELKQAAPGWNWRRQPPPLCNRIRRHSLTRVGTCLANQRNLKWFPSGLSIYHRHSWILKNFFYAWVISNLLTQFKWDFLPFIDHRQLRGKKKSCFQCISLQIATKIVYSMQYYKLLYKICKTCPIFIR